MFFMFQYILPLLEYVFQNALRRYKNMFEFTITDKFCNVLLNNEQNLLKIGSFCLSVCLPHALFSETSIPIHRQFCRMVRTVNPHACGELHCYTFRLRGGPYIPMRVRIFFTEYIYKVPISAFRTTY